MIYSNMKKSLTIILFSLALIMPHLAHADISTGLKEWLKFDEGSGTTAIDSSGTGNTGTLVNGPVYVPGNIGPYALNFNNGTPNAGLLVDVPGSSSLTLSGDGTLSAWINPTDFTTYYESILSKRHAGGDANDNYELFIDQGNHYLDFYNGTVFTTLTQVQTGTWTLITLVVSGSNCLYYINGILSTTFTSCGFGSTNTSDDFKVGYFTDGASDNQQYYGQEDDVRVYNRALSADDVAELYAYRPAAASVQPAAVSVSRQVIIKKGVTIK